MAHRRTCVECGEPADVRCTRRTVFRLVSAYLCRGCAPAWVRGGQTYAGMARAAVTTRTRDHQRRGVR
jgi:hypothetical protein